MFSERKSLVYFLTAYFISMMAFLAVFDYLYLKNTSFQILQKQQAIIKEKLLSNNLRFRFWNNDFNDLNVTIYMNGIVIKRSSQNGVCIDYELKRGFRNFKIVACKNFPDELKDIKEKLFLFNLIALVFMLMVAYFLAKLFLRPMKQEIINLENFFSDATHEIQTPISIINSNIEILELKNINFKEFKRIKNASFRLSKIFNDLKYLKFNNKNIQKIALKGFLNKRVEYFLTQIENKNLKLQLDIKEKFLNIDKEDLTKLIDNLLSNAIKYAPKYTIIFITLKNDFLEIVNSGKIKNIDNITKKFYRENKSEGGFGLGLYIVKNICEFYNFKLQIISKNQKISIKIYFVYK